MEKQDIESILLANCYLMQCKFGSCSSKIESAREFLMNKIRKALDRKLRRDSATRLY
jgi:hypothetical protein